MSLTVDMTGTVAARGKLKAAAAEGDIVPSFNDLIVKACAVALGEFPRAGLRGIAVDSLGQLRCRHTEDLAALLVDELSHPGDRREGEVGQTPLFSRREGVHPLREVVESLPVTLVQVGLHAFRVGEQPQQLLTRAIPIHCLDEGAAGPAEEPAVQIGVRGSHEGDSGRAVDLFEQRVQPVGVGLIDQLAMLDQVAGHEAVRRVGLEEDPELTRGLKKQSWEGGHRVPFIIRWPGKVKPGKVKPNTVSDAPFMISDTYATVAEILGVRLPDDVAIDSVNVLDIWEGAATKEDYRNRRRQNGGLSVIALGNA